MPLGELKRKRKAAQTRVEASDGFVCMFAHCTVPRNSINLIEWADF